jgi:hypothetical protein
MAQAFLKFDSIMAKNEEPDHETTPATAFWTQWELTLVGADVPAFNPAIDRADVGEGMTNSTVRIIVNAGDTAAQFATKVRAQINAAATARGVTVPASQVLIPTHQRM